VLKANIRDARAVGKAGIRHPLDPLDASEIARAVEILRRAGKATPEARFVSVTLNEPPKHQAAFPAPDHPVTDQPSGPGPAAAVGREAFLVWREPRRHSTCEAVVSLTVGSVLSWRCVPGAQAPFTSAEFAGCEVLTRADPQIRAGLERRGITDPGRVRVEAWGIGTYAAPDEAERRLVWTLLFYRARADDNPYAKPIDGLHAIVDLDDVGSGDQRSGTVSVTARRRFKHSYNLQKKSTYKWMQNLSPNSSCDFQPKRSSRADMTSSNSMSQTSMSNDCAASFAIVAFFGKSHHRLCLSRWYSVSHSEK